MIRDVRSGSRIHGSMKQRTPDPDSQHCLNVISRIFTGASTFTPKTGYNLGGGSLQVHDYASYSTLFN
jgi:hypothetical protein